MALHIYALLCIFSVTRVIGVTIDNGPIQMWTQSDATLLYPDRDYHAVFDETIDPDCIWVFGGYANCITCMACDNITDDTVTSYDILHTGGYTASNPGATIIDGIIYFFSATSQAIRQYDILGRQESTSDISGFSFAFTDHPIDHSTSNPTSSLTINTTVSLATTSNLSPSVTENRNLTNTSKYYSAFTVTEQTTTEQSASNVVAAGTVTSMTSTTSPSIDSGINDLNNNNIAGDIDMTFIAIMVGTIFGICCVVILCMFGVLMCICLKQRNIKQRQDNYEKQIQSQLFARSNNNNCLFDRLNPFKVSLIIFIFIH